MGAEAPRAVPQRGAQMLLRGPGKWAMRFLPFISNQPQLAFCKSSASAKLNFCIVQYEKSSQNSRINFNLKNMHLSTLILLMYDLFVLVCFFNNLFVFPS